MESKQLCDWFAVLPKEIQEYLFENYKLIVNLQTGGKMHLIDPVKREQERDKLIIKFVPNDYIILGINHYVWSVITEQEKKDYANLLWQEFYNQTTWIESICRMKKLTPNQVQKELDEYLTNQTLSGDYRRGINELKRHFINVLNKKL